jgi:hypothetical protein
MDLSSHRNGPDSEIPFMHTQICSKMKHKGKMLKDSSKYRENKKPFTSNFCFQIASSTERLMLVPKLFKVVFEIV